MNVTTAALLVLLAGVGQDAGDSGAEGSSAGAGESTVERGISKIVETMRASPALSTTDRLSQAAAAASGVIRPLTVPAAIFVTLLGFALLLFGQRLVKAGIIIYLVALFGFVGHEIGSRFGTDWQSLAGGGIGCLAGAVIALPLRALSRSIVGGLAGAILVAMVMQTFTSSGPVTLLAAAAGLVVSAVLAIYYPKRLMIIGYAMFGAAATSVGVLSIVTEPVNEHIAYGAAHIIGLILAMILGVVFQSQLGTKEE